MCRLSEPLANIDVPYIDIEAPARHCDQGILIMLHSSHIVVTYIDIEAPTRQCRQGILIMLHSSHMYVKRADRSTNQPSIPYMHMATTHCLE
jgi:hypothetical protein